METVGDDVSSLDCQFRLFIPYAHPIFLIMNS